MLYIPSEVLCYMRRNINCGSMQVSVVSLFIPSDVKRFSVMTLSHWKLYIIMLYNTYKKLDKVTWYVYCNNIFFCESSYHYL